ncbi:MAG: nucleotidyltransferase domain-containing protein [Alphaproteobacteria bacterium]|nr:nucleotidyltransferase domain-containing protein [Alphaproteobacteria bacterium]
MLHQHLKEKLPQIKKILKKYNISRAYAFGSVCTNRFNEKSDIDLLIHFQDNLNPLFKGQAIWDLEDELAFILNCNIDLITENQLKNPFFIKELNQTKKLIYGE